MERALTGRAAGAGSLLETSAGATVPRALQGYLTRLGLRDEALRRSLARDCLAQARKVVGPDAGEQLAARAIEELQRRLDRSLAKCLGLNPLRDAARIAGLRAALLMCTEDVSADFLLDGSDLSGHAEQIARLAACLPLATPPEAHLAMPAQPFEFLFFKSS